MPFAARCFFCFSHSRAATCRKYRKTAGRQMTSWRYFIPRPAGFLQSNAGNPVSLQQIGPDRHHLFPMTVECGSQGGYSVTIDTPGSPPDHAGHRARLRGRLLGRGVHGMVDYKLFRYLLAQAIPRRDTKALLR